LTLVAAQQEAVDLLGADSSTVPDLDEAFTLVPAERGLAELCYRRLTTPNGTLPGDLSFGLDLRSALNADLDAAGMGQLRADMEAQLLLDERIESVDLDVALTDGTLQVTLEGSSATGPFTLVLMASSASVQLLQGGV
jgi:hypothetical protein